MTKYTATMGASWAALAATGYFAHVHSLWTLTAQAIAVLAFLWVGYVICMWFVRMRDRGELTGWKKWAAYPVVLFFTWLDAEVNLMLATPIFWDIPEEWLLTARCNRHYFDEGRRGSLARFLCKRLLDPFAPGGRHCQR